jgi:hypothetical protein
MQAKIDARLEAKAAAGPPAPASDMGGLSDQPTPLSMVTVEERMGEISPQKVQAIQQLWRVRVQPMPLVARPHANRLWPRRSKSLTDSLIRSASDPWAMAAHAACHLSDDRHVRFGHRRMVRAARLARVLRFFDPLRVDESSPR